MAIGRMTSYWTDFPLSLPREQPQIQARYLHKNAFEVNTEGQQEHPQTFVLGGVAQQPTVHVY